MALGLILFARAPVDGNVIVDVIPATLAIGLGGGIAFNPLLLSAMGDVKPEESGLASGVWDSREDVRQSWEVDRRFEPTWSDAERESRYRAWQEAVGRARTTR